MRQDWSSVGKDTEKEVTAEQILGDVTALLLVRLITVFAPQGTYPDLSFYSVCKNVTKKQRDWPQEVSDMVIDELKEFCQRILKGYKDVPYHNQDHAHHVVLSACKLLDMIVYAPTTSDRRKQPPSYGLRNDPMLLFVVVFSALIHDTEHQGISNRELALEKDRLAVLYNDQSIAENWSLYSARRFLPVATPFGHTGSV